MRLYLIRHAESANNALFYGSDNVEGRTPDPEITQNGHQQAKLLGQHLSSAGNEPRQHPHERSENRDHGLTHIYCSLMTRSLLTAEYVAKACQIEVEALADIFERKGLYEFDDSGNEKGVPGPGRTYFMDRFPTVKLPDSLNNDGWWNRPVEMDQQFFIRVSQSLDKIKKRHEQTNDRVGMVVHGDYVDQCINELMGVERKPENYRKAWIANWVFHNTSLSRIDLMSGAQSVIYLNKIDHLPDNLVTW